MTIRAVIFDLGGVVLGSPLHAIASYERELGIPENFVNRVVADTAPDGAWSRLERGEFSLDEFFPAFEADCRAAGQCVPARVMFERMAAAALPRPSMLRAIARIRERGLSVAALTNNWASDEQGAEPDAGTEALRAHFDVFIESSVEGLRKPDLRIYRLACRRLDVSPDQAVFLDDIGSNLKAAREIGMTTIKVSEPAAALAELQQVLGFEL